jgi:hypothetical protein
VCLWAAAGWAAADAGWPDPWSDEDTLKDRHHCYVHTYPPLSQNTGYAVAYRAYPVATPLPVAPISPSYPQETQTPSSRSGLALLECLSSPRHPNHRGDVRRRSRTGHDDAGDEPERGEGVGREGQKGASCHRRKEQRWCHTLKFPISECEKERIIKQRFLIILKSF